MNAEILVGYLGANSSEQRIAMLLEELGTAAFPDLDDDDPDQHYDWVLIRKKGIELGFADAAYFVGKPSSFWRTEGLVLNQITFYSDTRDGVRPYTSELPHRLLLNDTRTAVRTKIAAYESARRSYLTDCWDTEHYRMIVAYKPEDQGLDCVHLKLNASPLDEREREQPHVAAHSWETLFGFGVTDPALQRALAPLDLPGRIARDGDRRELAFLAECGLQLYFERASELRLVGRSPKRDDLVLGGVKFHRARDLDARQYDGALPFGLRFDDSPEWLEHRVGSAPYRRKDGPLTGHALWHFDRASLHVVYSTVENHLFRVMLMAPGYWQDL